MTQHISYKQTAVLCLAVGMLFGVAVSSAYFVSNPVVETEHEIQYKTVEKPVSDDGMVFAIYRGRHRSDRSGGGGGGGNANGDPPAID
jgi:hypothetical protein